MAQRYFETRFTYDRKREAVWRVLTRYLQRYISLDAQILEVGAGYCHFINNIKGTEKHCLDIFEELPQYAANEVSPHVGSSCDMSFFENDRFDVVFCSNFLEHLTHDEATITIGEIARVLKERGRLIAIQPNYRYCAKYYFDDYTHKTVYSHVSLTHFFESNGFDLIRVTPRFMPFSMNSRLPKMSWLVAAYLRSPIKPLAQQMLVVAEKAGEKREE